MTYEDYVKNSPRKTSPLAPASKTVKVPKGKVLKDKAKAKAKCKRLGR